MAPFLFPNARRLDLAHAPVLDWLLAILGAALALLFWPGPLH